MNLFMLYLGGRHAQSFIELHDIRFVVAHTLEETYQELKQSWWGVPESLHLDSWGILKQVDGYDIHLRDIPCQQKEKLYFVNLGGYDPSQFTELHKNFCIVAHNELDAKQKAKESIASWTMPHKDYIYSVDDIWDIQTVLAKKNIYIELKAAKKVLPFEFTSDYIPIAVK